MIKAIRYALAALVFAFAFSAYAEIQEDEGVLVLTDENFDDAVAQHELILVEFYAPWCGHCKKLAPEWAKAAKILKSQSSPLPLAKVDATEQKQLAERFEIRGFPTIKFFRNGAPSDYSGGRTEQEIVSWFNKKAGPAARTLSSEADLLALQESNPVHVIGFINDASSATGKAFLAAAAQDDSAVYGISSSPEVRAKFNIPEGSEAVVIVKPFDEKRNDLTLTSSTTTDEIAAFVSGHARPLVHFFTKETAQQIFSSTIQVHLLFFTNKDAEHHQPLVDTFTEVAKGVRGKALAVNIPHSESRILEYFGVSEADLPVVYIADMRSGGSMKKYKVSGDLNKDHVLSVAHDFFAGRLKPSLKSESAAEDDLTGPVKVLRGNTFQDVVMNNDKDVFVEFYAPWCGHCKKLAPVWDELGAKFSSGDVVIAKMDSTANEIDVEGVEVQGFPTLYFFKGNDKANPIKYEGGRELEALTNFINENAVHKTATTADEL